MTRVPRRWVTAAVLAAAGIACAVGAVRDPSAPGAGRTPARPVATQSPGLFSVRRVPEFLARFVAQRRLDRELDAAFAGSHACLIARGGDVDVDRRDVSEPLAAASSQKLLIAVAALK